MMNLSAEKSPQRSQDPSADLDWSKDWTAWLEEVGGDTISLSTWVVTPTGPSLHNGGMDTPKKITTIWVKSVTIGVNYTLTNDIITNGVGGGLPRTNDSSFRLYGQQE